MLQLGLLYKQQGGESDLPFEFKGLLQEWLNDIDINDVMTLTKAFNLVTSKEIEKLIPSIEVGKFKVQILKFMAVAYKKQNKFTIAIQTLQFILKMEDAIVDLDPLDHIATQLSLVALMSQQKQHNNAIDILKSMQFSTTQKTERELKLQCIQLYDLGVEYEHIGQLTKAIDSLNEALLISKENQFDEMTSMIEIALLNVRTK